MTSDGAATAGERLRTGEFIPLVALLFSLVALSIDGMLPALPEIGRDLGVARANDVQYVILSVFLGLGLGQVLFGPLSDRIGRKPAIYAGLGVFMAGCVVSVVAPDFETMIAGRVLQGIGVAGPRIVTVALVRDQYAGRPMARIMSFAMAVFILVPAVAPASGSSSSRPRGGARSSSASSPSRPPPSSGSSRASPKPSPPPAAGRSRRAPSPGRCARSSGPGPPSGTPSRPASRSRPSSPT